jgi:hypothetical protein
MLSIPMSRVCASLIVIKSSGAADVPARSHMMQYLYGSVCRHPHCKLIGRLSRYFPAIVAHRIPIYKRVSELGEGASNRWLHPEVSDEFAYCLMENNIQIKGAAPPVRNRY